MELPVSLIQPAAPFLRGLPPQMNGCAIPGAAPFYACWEGGCWLLQRTTGGNTELLCSHSRAGAGDRLQVALHVPLLSLHLALEGAYHWRRAGMDYSLKKGQLQLVHLPQGSLEVEMVAGECRAVDLLLPLPYLSLFEESYGVLSPFLRQVSGQQAAWLSARPLTASRAVERRVQQLLRNPFQGVLRSMYFDAQLMEILVEVLEIATGHTAVLPPVGPEEMERVEAVRQLLEQQVDQRITVAQLARRAHMNVVKLNQGFRMLTGTTLFDYHLQRRMEKARALLQTTRLPLDDIALETGYEHLSSFIAAFKAIHGVTPATYRRSKGK